MPAGAGQTQLIGWLFAPGGAGVARICGLPAGRYTVSWSDPWSGDAIGAPSIVAITPRESELHLDPGLMLAALRRQTPAFPDHGREDRGEDIAFAIAPNAPP